ncbi:MAG: amidinotransferase [Porphyromonas sp.]|nr:amidinotransferase [Porphyromonas sp.]
MRPLNIYDETSTLRSVVVGIGSDNGPIPRLEDAYDAKSYDTIIKGIYPTDEELDPEVEGLARTLEKEGVEVLRPQEISGINQIFARDVAFVVEDKLIKANIIPDRAAEQQAYDEIYADIDPDKIIVPPEHVHIEGGDVLLMRDKIFLGCYLSPDYPEYNMARTNKYAIGFLKEHFPNKDIVPLELIKHDTDPYQGVLHLDCAFQPVGEDKAILFPGAFRHTEDWEYIFDLYGANNTCVITRQEMYEMNTNVFSISPTCVIIDETFTRLRDWLERRGISCIGIPYRQVSKLGGLLRCTTQPLYRE